MTANEDWNAPLPPLVAALEASDMQPYARLALRVVRQACADLLRTERHRGLAPLEAWLRSDHAAVYLELLGLESAVRERVIATILAKALRGELDTLLAQDEGGPGAGSERDEEEADAWER